MKTPGKFKPADFETKWPRTSLTSSRLSSPRSRGAAIRGKQSFNPSLYEGKWQTLWEKYGIYQPDLKNAKRPFYNLMMFPYPSAEGLHVGNMYAFTGADIYGRFKRMQGYDVFEPIGLDGFGIHSENYAIKIGKHPAVQAKISEKNFYRQLHAIGNGFAWKNTLETYDPDYYRWTQWIFVQMFKHGLAYKKKSAVNFCPSCKTVLSDEQVIDGLCERCKSTVEKKQMEQWFFKITAYAEKLLQNTYRKDFYWSEKVKIGQRNWIGRSEGVRIEFKIQNSKFKIDVFTTAIDTVFGTTFMVLSPDHPLITDLSYPETHKQEVEKYIDNHKLNTKNANNHEEKEKTGVFTGLYAINPFNNKEIPIWVADYVLMDYGTGAVMGVPGHDSRDYEFARKFKLSIIPVIKPSSDVRDVAEVAPDGFWDYEEIKTKYADKSIIFDSGFIDGLTSKEAKKKLEKKIKEMKIGVKVVSYKLRDWCISRQRYWGTPIPMINCPKCGWVAVPEDQLPVLLPYIKDYRPQGRGVSPLASHKEFYEVACPKCGSAARRETDVCDTFLDSSWYHLRYPSVDSDVIPSGSEESLANASSHSVSSNESRDSSASPQNDTLLPWDPEITKHWLPVTQYTGGAEHAVLHLLYARFVWMCFYDWGLFDFSAQGGPASGWEEPFSHFYAHGLIIAEGAKMSKSKGNVVIPDEYIKTYGADTLRTYLMFLGPFDMGGDFRDTGIAGMYRFLSRVWRLVHGSLSPKLPRLPRSLREKDHLDRVMHRTIKEVTEDIENLRYNTAIAHIMTYVNELTNNQQLITNNHIKSLLLMLAPFAPHMTEELWEKVPQVSKVPQVPRTYNSRGTRDTRATRGTFPSIHLHPWPSFDPQYLIEDEVTIVVQINGKTRDIISVKREASSVKDEVEREAEKSEKVQKYLSPASPISPKSPLSPRKTIFVPGKLINFVI